MKARVIGGTDREEPLRPLLFGEMTELNASAVVSQTRWLETVPAAWTTAQTGGIDNPSRADLSLEAASGTDVSTATACTDTHMASRDSICWISVLSLRDFHGSLEVSFRRIKNSVSRLLNVVLFSFQMYILRNVLTNPNCIPKYLGSERRSPAFQSPFIFTNLE